MFGFLRGIFGGHKSSTIDQDRPSDVDIAPEADEPEYPPRADDDPAYEQTEQALSAYFRTLGEFDSDILASILPPSLEGKPGWPGGYRQFQPIRTTDSLVLATRGLSAPYNDIAPDDTNGHEMELLWEQPGAQNLEMSDISSTVAFSVIAGLADGFASMGGIKNRLDANQVLITQVSLSDPDIDPRWIEDGAIAVLIGVRDPKRAWIIEDMPISSVTMLAVTPLLPDEYRYGAQSQQAGIELAKMLVDSGNAHRADLDRQSVTR